MTEIKLVIFDLDGTLLPMDQDMFTKTYFGLLAKKLAPHGYEPKQLVDVIWAGTAEMVKNDGRQSNEEAFWKKYAEVYGEKAVTDKPLFDEFYRGEFQKAGELCEYDPQVPETVKKIKKMGYRVALATNPIFPAEATESRIRWAGLSPDDFELYTTYENIGFCKPNLEYYREILNRLKVKPEECLMVGNDVDEDMVVEELGMHVFLLTNCLVNRKAREIGGYPHGGFAELLQFCAGQE